MAFSVQVSRLTDELISTIAKVSDKNSSEFKQLKKYTEKALKNSSYLRTNKFEVLKSLDGLQQKFQVVGNDELADALHIRLNELNKELCPLAPEILSLLLLLSDNPATLSAPEDIKTYKPVDFHQPLTWADLKDSESTAEIEDLWKDVDFAAVSSDDDISLASSDVSIPKIVPHSSMAASDEFRLPDDLYIDAEDDILVSKIIASRIETGSDDDANTGSVFYLTELQVIQELIYMLQGLPVTIFSVQSNQVIPKQNYSLRHSSKQSFGSLLKPFCLIGSSIRSLREFAKRPQNITFMQTFVKEIENLIASFDEFMSNQMVYYSFQIRPSPSISLIHLLHKVQEMARILLDFADLISKLDERPSENFLCLDLLYDLACTKQATGQDKAYFQVTRLFLKCFESYSRTVRLWMKSGELDPDSKSSFFITASNHANDLNTLWHRWFTFNDRSGRLYAPNFLHPSSKKIFITGKSMIFLRYLGIIPSELETKNSEFLSYEDICPSNQSSSLYPFSGKLASLFDQFVDSNYTVACSLLKTQLDEKCGLWDCLKALEYIYLGKDYSRSSSLDYRIFESIDRGINSWNDRFLVTELVQQAFSSLDFIDTTRLIGHSSKVPPLWFERYHRSVKILRAISADYMLPWPVANIITKNTISVYKRVSLLLMQIRRAKFTLEKRWFAKLHLPSAQDEEMHTYTLSFGIRHYLLRFLNTLYHYMTEVVISPSTRDMVKDAKESKDVDSMIEIHEAYVASLEGQCLLSNDFAHVHRAIISLLDLCIRFSDTQVAHLIEHHRYQNEQSLLGFSQHISNGRKQLGLDGNIDSDDSDDDGAKMEISMFEAGNVSTISFVDESYRSRLLKTRASFDELHLFIKSELRAGNGEYQQIREMLADMFDWKV
ncbi:hypothetical protein FQN57_000664 [Myotisia sp. PD_48]|nr:hypothetical protein FQN57_000664 [Myotisia sp. PD_48]